MVAACSFLGDLLFLVPFFGLSSGFGEKYQREQSLALSAHILERQCKKGNTYGEPYAFLGWELAGRLRFIFHVSA